MDFLGTLILCLLIIFILIQALTGGKKSYGKLPPGPKPYPVIGNLLEVGENPYQSLAKLSKTYGSIMSLKLGQVTTIVVSSATMAKEFLHTHDLAVSTYRGIPDSATACNFANYAMPLIPISTRWRILRKIWSTYLFSNKKLEGSQDVRLKKVQDLLARVDASCQASTAVDIGQLVFRTTVNILSNIMFSADLVEPKSDHAQGFKEIVSKLMEEVGRTNVADFFPVLKMFDPHGSRRRATVLLGKLLDVLKKVVNERLKLREATGRSTTENDLLDILLNICEDNGGEFEREWIEYLFLDIFIGGNDTSSNTLEWAMAELLRNPETLLKAQGELRSTIGKGKQVEELDLPRLPYLEAVVRETLRLHPPAPLLAPRTCGVDLDISGLIVPKGAQIMINAWAIGRDPTTWDEPNAFKPKRFLGSEIDFRGKNFEMIPFAAGRRICPGLPFAVRVVPLILASLIHSFNWKLADELKPEDICMEEKFGLTLRKKKPLLVVPLPP